jgi:hypothetical protein
LAVCARRHLSLPSSFSTSSSPSSSPFTPSSSPPSPAVEKILQYT